MITQPIPVLGALPESPFFIRDRGVLHHVEPLTKPSRTNSTVLVRATRFGTLMRVENRDLIRDY